jgi:hypothetical protein
VHVSNRENKNARVVCSANLCVTTRSVVIVNKFIYYGQFYVLAVPLRITVRGAHLGIGDGRRPGWQRLNRQKGSLNSA